MTTFVTKIIGYEEIVNPRMSGNVNLLKNMKKILILLNTLLACCSNLVFGQTDNKLQPSLTTNPAVRQTPIHPENYENGLQNSFFDPSKAGITETKSVEGTLAVTNPSISGPNNYCGYGYLYASPYNNTYTYQWSYSTTAAGTFVNIPGATSNSFQMTLNYNVGFYKVAINDGTTPVSSPVFNLKQGHSPSLASSNGSNFVTIPAGSSTSLNVNYSGPLPYAFTLISPDGFRRNYESNTASTSIIVTPDTYKNYYLAWVIDASGYQCSSNSVAVNVTPLPNLLLNTPATTSVCAGNIIDLPITKNGTWGTLDDQIIAITLVSPSGSYISNSYMTNQGAINVLKYLVPPSIPTGTYYVKAYGNAPYTNNATSSYAITVTNLGCATNQALIVGKETGCGDYSLTAFPRGFGYTYQWYKDNVAINYGENGYYTLGLDSPNGNYSVVVTNTTLGYSATSAVKTITRTNFRPVLSATNNGLICGAGGASTITTGSVGTGYTYQWYKYTYINGEYIPIPLFGETGAAVMVNTPGSYYVNVWDGSCQTQSSSIVITACPPVITSINPILCGANTQVVLQANSNGSSNYQWSNAPYQYGTFTDILGATGSSYTVTTTGYYKVTDNAGLISNAFWVANAPYMEILNPSGNQNPMTIAAGGTAAITYKLYGSPPFSFTTTDGVNTRQVYATTNQLTLNFTPSNSRYYTVDNLTSAGCNITTSNIQSRLQVNVGTPFTLSAGAIPSTICDGNILSVPYTFSGTYDSNVNIKAYMLEAFTGSFITSLGSSSTNPLQFQLPSPVSPRNYVVYLYGDTPIINSIIVGNLTVTAPACTPTAQASIQGFSNVCEEAYLTAIPNGVGYSYQWYKDGILIPDWESFAYYANQSGNYTVKVTNVASSYNSTSAVKNVVVNGVVPAISSPNASFCGSNTSVMLTTTLTGAGYTYLWQRYNPNNFSYTTIFGQNTQTLTLTQASDVGDYRVVVFDGSCDNVSELFKVSTTTTARLVNSSGNTSYVNLFSGQTENLKLHLSGQSPWTYTFNGVNYSTSVSPVTLPVSPSVSTDFNAFNVLSSGTACGTSSTTSNFVYVSVLPNPCPSLRNLVSPMDDISSGTVIKEANAVSGTITATNLITGTAKVTYRAGKSITLNPGFKIDNGTVFKTEFGGCN